MAKGVARGNFKTRQTLHSPPLPSLPLPCPPFPSPPLRSRSLRSRTPWIQLGGLWERCKLPQCRQRFWFILRVYERFWLPHNSWYHMHLTSSLIVTGVVIYASQGVGSGGSGPPPRKLFWFIFGCDATLLFSTVCISHLTYVMLMQYYKLFECLFVVVCNEKHWNLLYFQLLLEY